MLITLILAFIWALAWLYFDSYYTNKGIKAGFGVEGNGMITTFWGPKPKFWQLWSVDGTLRVAIFLAAQFVPSSAAYPHALQSMGIGALVACGFKNWQGGRQWKWLFANKGKTIPQMNTFWSKILGFWG